MSAAQSWRMDRGVSELVGSVRGITARAVVLVSADAGMMHRLGAGLTQLRWSVRQAAGGAEAMAMIELEQPEAIVIDGWLPDLEVGEFAAYMEKHYPAMDLLRVDGRVSAGKARSPRRNELLHAIRVAQEFAPQVEERPEYQRPAPTKAPALVRPEAPANHRAERAASQILRRERVRWGGTWHHPYPTHLSSV